jgi:hypothetical protein
LQGTVKDHFLFGFGPFQKNRLPFFRWKLLQFCPNLTGSSCAELGETSLPNVNAKIAISPIAKFSLMSSLL